MKEVWTLVECHPYEGCDEPERAFSTREKASEWLTAEYDAARRRRVGPSGVRRTVKDCDNLEIAGPITLDEKPVRKPVRA